MMKNANTEAAEIVEDLNPLSDRYRVCPNCQAPHMVRNRGRDFCSDRCADQHYNARRRLMKQAEPKNNTEDVAHVKTTAAAPPDDPATIATQNPIVLQEQQLTAYDRNILFLDAQTIHPETGTRFFIDDFIKSGFVFEACASRGVLHNTDPKLNCHFVQYGKYRIYRVDFSHVLIHKNEHLKTKTDD